MKRVLKSFLANLIFVFVNYIISYIPCWILRKFFYRLCGMKIGKKSRIMMGCKIFSPWKIKIGKNTIVNESCILDGRGTLQIGNNCSISLQTVILTADHNYNSNIFEYRTKKVVIGDYVWVGTRATILGGSYISDFDVIGAQSLVSGYLEPNFVYFGSPVKKIKNRKVECAYNIDTNYFFR